MVPHPPTCLRITPISAYFSPIFCLWYPILIINSSICCPFAIFPPTCLRILLIFRLKFRLFSARPVLPGCRCRTRRTWYSLQNFSWPKKFVFSLVVQTRWTVWIIKRRQLFALPSIDSIKCKTAMPGQNVNHESSRHGHFSNNCP